MTWGLRLLVGLTLSVVALAACTDEEPPPATEVPASPTSAAVTEVPASPTGPASATVPVTPAPSPTEAQPPPQPVLATVAPADVQGLETRTESVQGDPYRYFATHPVIEAFPLLGDTLAAAIEAERMAFEAARGPFDPVPPEAAGPSFNVSFDVLAASGDVLGVHLLFYAFFGANGAESSATFWFDLDANRAVSPAGLFDGEAGLAAAVAEVRSALETRFGTALFPDQVEAYFAAAEENLKAIGFTSAGDLLFIIDECRVGPCALGRIAISLPAATAEPHLSDFGRSARAETLRPSGPLRIPATPTPAPTPVPPLPPSTGSVDCAATACVALTFDDGPAGPTSLLLDALAAAGAPATFFVVGVNAQYQPELLARMVAEGHEVGNHTYDHRDLTTLSAEQIAAQWNTTSEIVAAATGLRPLFFRPPYGASNEKVRSVVDAPFILWSVDPRDWADKDTSLITRRVLEAARAGDIILLHDIYRTSTDAVPAIITGLRQQGFTLVTVSTLLGGSLEPGATYRRR